MANRDKLRETRWTFLIYNALPLLVPFANGWKTLVRRRLCRPLCGRAPPFRVGYPLWISLRRPHSRRAAAPPCGSEGGEESEGRSVFHGEAKPRRTAGGGA